MIPPIEDATVNTVSGLIQLAVAPVFLIAGVGAILGVLSGRLARITDRIERLNIRLNEVTSDAVQNRRSTDLQTETVQAYKIQRKYLQIRAKNMNLAILFCIVTGLLVSTVIVALFSSLFFEFSSGVFIGFLFISGMLSFMVSMVLFIREIFMATYFMKRTQEKMGVE